MGNIDFDNLSGAGWAELLITHPEYADKCQWLMLDGCDWAGLLREQPQFFDKCPADILSGYNWEYLLCK